MHLQCHLRYLRRFRWNCSRVQCLPSAAWASISQRPFSFTKGVDVLEGALEKRTQVTGYGDQAFSINNVLVRSSVILLPNQFFLWNVREFSEIDVASLQVFALLVPTIEVLLIGA